MLIIFKMALLCFAPCYFLIQQSETCRLMRTRNGRVGASHQSLPALLVYLFYLPVTSLLSFLSSFGNLFDICLPVLFTRRWKE